MPRTPVTAVVAALLLASFPAADAAATPAERTAPAVEAVLLDAAAGGDDDAGRAGALTRQAWPSGTYAVVEAQGTFSRWAGAVWGTRGVCGVPEPSPAFPSAGGGQGLVGQDAEVEFAQSYACDADDAPLPRHLGDLLIDAGGGFTHPQAVGGPYSTPRPDHRYTYVVVGTGKRIAFRVRDVNAGDNYGRLRLVVRTASRADCAGEGWRAFGEFVDEAQCAALLPGTSRRPAPAATLRFDSPPAAVRTGGTAVLRGFFSGTGAPVTTVDVELWSRPAAGRWSRTAVLRPTAAGRVAAGVKPRVTTAYQLRLPGSTTRSAVTTLQLTPRIVVPARLALASGRSGTVRGTVEPRRRGLRVELWSGRRRQATARTGPAGGFALRVPAGTARRATLDVVVPRTAALGRGVRHVVLTRPRA
ncbi:hypothetical protein [Motilibacter aurantiacus]|uniref:hypothetical protein n=1 Tax=Motilibacter aurantiacus TaxID=2714955 RepID=UPI00140DE045|nr:hypothetical protein [Motilibacter aurantiacus]NHC43835.1 hypothetical protein [Motilibacter aurantiacus]